MARISSGSCGDVRVSYSSRRYDLSVAKKHCEKRGLHWDGRLAEGAIELARMHRMTQAAFTDAVRMHIDAMAEALTPQRYPWKARVVMAFMWPLIWLGVVRPPWNKRGK